MPAVTQAQRPTVAPGVLQARLFLLGQRYTPAPGVEGDGGEDERGDALAVVVAEVHAQGALDRFDRAEELEERATAAQPGQSHFSGVCASAVVSGV
ncbi:MULTISPECIES: hypothetical protein [unclassified Streptomyces]|uniref:hypothetical protein n=1 Tax=unclassified Streptomyces TaxID=2593676 RepID=UPI0013BE8C0E|nr:hypothetical protein [Streptomyces sp. CB09001]